MRTIRITLYATLVVLLTGCGGGTAGIYNVAKFGAHNDGLSLTTDKIQRAIDRCAEAGGGVVYVPKGDYLVGTLNLRSNVEFRMETGARLIATTDLSQYQKHNDELAGVFYTEDASNVSITGHGVIFGQGMEFMYADSAKVIAGPALDYVRQGNGLRKVAEGIGDGPLYPKDRFHQMIVFSNCTDVELHDFKCVDSPYWCFLIVHCVTSRAATTRWSSRATTGISATRASSASRGLRATSTSTTACSARGRVPSASAAGTRT